jgi:hypothetical protein
MIRIAPMDGSVSLHVERLLVGYWARSRPTYSGQPLPSRRTKRTLARAATVACLLFIGVLAASFGGGEVNPFQVLVSGLAVGGMGFNVGGCGGSGPGLAGWVFMLATWGIGLGFKRWLDRVHPGGATVERPTH